MVVSPEKIAANQRNAAKSTGPKTEAGKANSRRNSFKHGLTGAGIVLPNEDAEALESRFKLFEAELRPSGEVGRCLVRRAAFLTIRQERCIRYETAVTSIKMRKAQSEFDEARLAEVDQHFQQILIDPYPAVRCLVKSPEGIARLIEEFEDIKFDLENNIRVWDYHEAERIDNLTGRRSSLTYPRSRVQALSEAMMGRDHLLSPGEQDHLSSSERKEWARVQLVEFIDARVARLKQYREGIDLDAIAQDREDMVDVALFETTNDRVLFRKYDAATARELKSTLQEIRRLKDQPETVSANLDQVESYDDLASFRQVEARVAELASLDPEATAPTTPERLENGRIESNETVNPSSECREGSSG